MLARSCMVLTVLCGCAGLGPIAGWESRPALVPSLAGWNGGYRETVGGSDARMGLVFPNQGSSLSIGPRLDMVYTKYFKAESFSVESGGGIYLMADGQWEDNDYTGGWIYVVPVTCVGKYFFELIYKSGVKVYVGLGVGLYVAGTMNEPAVTIDPPIAFGFPFCFGVELSREDRSAIDIEFRFDTLGGPVFDAVAEPPATVVRTPGEANLGVTFISVNWKGVF